MTLSPDARLQLSAQRALYGAVGPSLVRFTGEIKERTILLQWVVLSGSTEGEIENYRVAGSEIVADYLDETIEEQFLTVSKLNDANLIPPLRNHFFCRNLNGASQ